ncbi:Heat induced stress protein YflT [Bacillus sp. OV322]|uniref:general stress protein n=1 Tax=Bacillus sp. OV322 TaxID=1882764 RepID=UPI0008E4E190|nr:general stress protein [Bacillus sp. OV322]SFC75754.1 Heat induced stress protein YflT [Bacillus sp. OV322]
MVKKIIGAYENEEQAIAAIEKLKNSGYTEDEISVVAKDMKKLDELEPEAEKVSAKGKDGMMTGVAAGGAIGLTGFFVGMDTFLMTGIGPLLAAGPIFATLGGAAAGLASKSGGLADTLQDMGVAEKEAKAYEDDVKNGKILIITDEK